MTPLIPVAYHLSSGEAIEEKMNPLIILRTALRVAALIVLPLTISYAQETYGYAYKAPVDSIKIGEYWAVTYEFGESPDRIGSMMNEIIFYRNDRRVLSVAEGKAEIIDFCQQEYPINDSCYLRDINADGTNDIIVSYFTGGANCCFGGNIYCIDDSLRAIFQIEPNAWQFGLDDIENDGIPEIVFPDQTFEYWKTSYKTFMPRLIWRWDGEKYRIANFAFKDYLLLNFPTSPIDTICREMHNLQEEGLRGDVQRWASSTGFWDVVITLTYAGEINRADSIFMHCWPESIPGKMEEFRAFKKELEGGKYWKELQQSNW